MGKEYEAKFLDVDPAVIRKKLKDLGAEIVHKKMKYIRAVFHLCNSYVKGYARIRQENDKITMTVKTYKDPKFPEEYEVEIKDSTFEDGINFLKALGIEQKAYQETYREKWSHPLAHELTIDDIPGLPTYMEVDCTSEEDLNKLIDLLELDKSKMRFGAFDATYEEYYGIEKHVINNETPVITFDDIINQIKPKKNMDLLKKLWESYKETGGKETRKRKKKGGASSGSKSKTTKSKTTKSKSSKTKSSKTTSNSGKATSNGKSQVRVKTIKKKVNKKKT